MWLRKTTPSSRISLIAARGVDLEAAGIRQDRTLPAHEAVEAAECPDELVSRTEVEVIRVREDHGSAHAGHLVGRERLDGPERPDGHEGWRLHDPVRGMETPRARCALRSEELEGEAGRLRDGGDTGAPAAQGAPRNPAGTTAIASP